MSCLTGSEEGFSATCGASCNGQLTSSACNKIDTSDAVLRAPYIDKCLSLKLTTDGGPARSSACGSGLVSGAKEGCKEGLSILGNMDKYKAEADARAAAVGTPALGTPASPPTPPTPVASPEVAPPSPQPELVANGEASAAVNEEEEETGEGTEASNDNLRGN